MVKHREIVTAHAHEVLRMCGIAFEKTSEIQRQVAGAFMFGVVFAHGMGNKLSPPDVQALAICVLTDALKYSPEQAGAFSSQLVEAMRAGPSDTMNSITHRGIDGHRQLTQRDQARLTENLLGIFAALGDPYAA